MLRIRQINLLISELGLMFQSSMALISYIGTDFHSSATTSDWISHRLSWFLVSASTKGVAFRIWLKTMCKTFGVKVFSWEYTSKESNWGEKTFQVFCYDVIFYFFQRNWPEVDLKIKEDAFICNTQGFNKTAEKDGTIIFTNWHATFS